MKNTTLATLLVIVCSAAVVATQSQTETTEVQRRSEELLGQLEEVAMCHHAIKAAHHDALALNQNPYYRYILNSPHRGQGANVYPIPERCKTLATNWILNYTNMSTAIKAVEDKTVHDTVGMTISEMATDAQFLTIVISKKELEGDKADLWENRDKDIP